MKNFWKMCIVNVLGSAFGFGVGFILIYAAWSTFLCRDNFSIDCFAHHFLHFLQEQGLYYFTFCIVSGFLAELWHFWYESNKKRKNEVKTNNIELRFYKF